MSSFRIYLGCFLGLLIAGTWSCKKSTDNQQSPVAAVVYPKGSSLAQAVLTHIGAAGGTLSSADGIVSIVVPGGAVSLP